MEAKNAALEAARRAKIEALKIRNWLMGQAMLQNALGQSGLSQAEQERVRAEARTKGVSAALGLLDSLKQAAQARLQASWRAMEKRLQQVDEWEERRQREREQQGRSQWDMARWKEADYAESVRWEAQQAAAVTQSRHSELDSATRSYMAWAKAVEERKLLHG